MNMKNKTITNRAGRRALERTTKIITTAVGKQRKMLPQPNRRQPKVDVDLARYYLALTDPFHPGAVGARVPDMFACPTVTRTIRSTFTLTVNASGVAGCVVMPNPIAAIACFNGFCSEFSGTTYCDGTTIAQSRWGIDPTTKSDRSHVVAVSQGVDTRLCLPKAAWPPTCCGLCCYAKSYRCHSLFQWLLL